MWFLDIRPKDKAPIAIILLSVTHEIRICDDPKYSFSKSKIGI